MNDLSFHTLLYRYFFFGWLFRQPRPDADLFERAAARRHNRQQARWLLVYTVRWVWLAVLFFGIGTLLAVPDGIAQMLFAASGVCVAVAVMTTTAWFGLTRGEELL